LALWAQWALDNGQTGAVKVTEKNFAPYLLHPPKSVAGERHLLKTLVESPEAHLTHKLEPWPAGSVLRLSTNGGVEVSYPN
jgi:hypothetical protein